MNPLERDLSTRQKLIRPEFKKQGISSLGGPNETILKGGRQEGWVWGGGGFLVCFGWLGFCFGGVCGGGGGGVGGGCGWVGGGFCFFGGLGGGGFCWVLVFSENPRRCSGRR